ncbi:MAG: HAMP domain-containing histidine kinase [Cytophagales bacterium]|jgi:signal transduction histidine kinase|nr:HAMP domain-containing histidine kinase [Cytophagales bacterium]
MSQPLLKQSILEKPVTENKFVRRRENVAPKPRPNMRQRLNRIADWISRNGVKPDDNKRLKINVALTNWVIVICAVFALPYFGLYIKIGQPELAAPSLLCCLVSFLLMRYGFHLVGRLVIAYLCPLAIYLLAAFIDVPETTGVSTIKPLFFATFIIPLLIFRLNELRYLVGSLVFIALLLFTVDYANEILGVEVLVRDKTDLIALQVVSTAETAMFIIASVLYCKFLVGTISRDNRRLIQDMRNQNEVVRQANEGLRASTQQLKEMNDSKTRLFSIIAHDLRSPMNSFRGFSGLLANNLDTLSKQDINVLVKGMNKSFQSVNTLLENLLHWSRVQMNTLGYHPEMVDLSVLVGDNLTLAEMMAMEKKITVSGSVREGLYAYVDKNMFNVVLRNLLTNAVKFTNAGGRVEVKAESGADNILITVTDNGVGMSQTVLENLFASRSHNHTTPGTANERGTGLGLMLCREFVEKWNGTLKANSVKGQGSTFSFTVPAYQSKLFE